MDVVFNFDSSSFSSSAPHLSLLTAYPCYMLPQLRCGYQHFVTCLFFQRLCVTVSEVSYLQRCWFFTRVSWQCPVVIVELGDLIYPCLHQSQLRYYTIGHSAGASVLRTPGWRTATNSASYLTALIPHITLGVTIRRWLWP